MFRETKTFTNPPGSKPDPWPLAVDAPIRVVAWPDYASAREIGLVLDAVRPLLGREVACLCLRHDPEVDIPLVDAVAAVEEVFSVLDRNESIHVLMLDEQMLRTDWPRIGVNARCAIQTNANNQDIRSQFIRAQNTEIVRTGKEEPRSRT